MMNEKVFRANGKLLLTGEYVVLDGARALALPTQQGQRLRVREVELAAPTLLWQSATMEGKVWFDAVFGTHDFEIVSATDAGVAMRLQRMLRYVRAVQPSFLASGSFSVRTELEFDREWGLGSSSTLLVTLAQWGGVDAFELLFHTMKGSGYDIACGMTDTALLYWLEEGKPQYEALDYEPPFADQLYFVYRGQKQNSREGIARYRAQSSQGREELVAQINALTEQVRVADSLKAMEEALQVHEALIGKAIGMRPVQQSHFADYEWGIVKSLGAWGGDFVLATSSQNYTQTSSYFEKKGCMVCLPYREIIKIASF